MSLNVPAGELLLYASANARVSLLEGTSKEDCIRGTIVTEIVGVLAMHADRHGGLEKCC